jgi:hypothetical protein
MLPVLTRVLEFHNDQNICSLKPKLEELTAGLVHRDIKGHVLRNKKGLADFAKPSMD